jgi:nicotinamidase/pyrazinamidase
MEERSALPIDTHSVLVVVDVQNGFMPGGGLPVPRGDEVVPVINLLAQRFKNVVVTQDWHPAGHASFASSHAGASAYDVMAMPYGPQVLWPDHCVQGTQDAALHTDLHVPHAQLIIRKGFHPLVDSYSAFMEADRTTTTGLAAYLQARGMRKVFVCGLATDFCVAWTALDARAAGFDAAVVEDACRAIDLNGSLAQAWHDLHAAGVQRVQSQSLA